jgi:hypothetical protein
MPVEILPTLRSGDGLKTPNLQDEVKRLQTLLGFSENQIDGRFGSATEAAVRRFQRSRGLKVDGIVGQGTWSALLSSPSTSASTPPIAQIEDSSDRWSIALTKASPKGASAITAGQDGRSAGVAASQEMARNDLSRVLAIADTLRQVGTKFSLPPVVLAAIASRESRCGAALENGWGDHGNAFGIMQIDRRFHNPLAGLPNPASLEHIEQAANLLMDRLTQLVDKHPDWEDEFILQGAIAAYNVGVDNIRTKTGIDRGTTGDDYGSDVLARAQFYLHNL